LYAALPRSWTPTNALPDIGERKQLQAALDSTALRANSKSMTTVDRGTRQRHSAL
jgi:hypothetical protein